MRVYQALAAGIVDVVVDIEDLEATVMKLARELAPKVRGVCVFYSCAWFVCFCVVFRGVSPRREYMKPREVSIGYWFCFFTDGRIFLRLSNEL